MRHRAVQDRDRREGQHRHRLFRGRLRPASRPEERAAVRRHPLFGRPGDRRRRGGAVGPRHPGARAGAGRPLRFRQGGRRPGRRAGLPDHGHRPRLRRRQGAKRPDQVGRPPEARIRRPSRPDQHHQRLRHGRAPDAEPDCGRHHRQYPAGPGFGAQATGCRRGHRVDLPRDPGRIRAERRVDRALCLGLCLHAEKGRAEREVRAGRGRHTGELHHREPRGRPREWGARVEVHRQGALARGAGLLLRRSPLHADQREDRADEGGRCRTSSTAPTRPRA